MRDLVAESNNICNDIIRLRINFRYISVEEFINHPFVVNVLDRINIINDEVNILNVILNHHNLLLVNNTLDLRSILINIHN
jgi:hypothetical protein